MISQWRLISIHRIAQIFRKLNVDISTQHLMRAIRLFIKEGERTKGKASAVQGPGTFEKTQKAPITYRVPEAASALVREEEFAKQLRLTRYLAGASLGPPRAVEKVGDRARSVTMPKPRTKAQAGNKKGAEAELARERRRAQQSGQHKASSGRGRREKQRSGLGR
jgi:hypothetical protein